MDMYTLFARAEEPDIVAVATNCCGIRLTRQGTRHQCLCPNPYHHDKHMGSFSINAATKFWGCFACDLGQHCGNVSLVSTLNNVSRLEAAVDICVTFGLISQGEAAELLRSPQKRDCFVRNTVSGYTRPEHVKERKPVEVLDAVYRSFIEAAPAMRQEQKASLMAERNLTPEDMEDFFLLPPKTQAFWANFKKKLAKNGQTGTLNDILTGVPGFMRYAKSHRWSFVGRAGCLCLVSRNVSGQILGFQMRTNRADAKYIGFSSGSADDIIYDSCCSFGVLVDVLPPRGRESNVIAVTEGKFKGLTLSKMGVWSISVAGVGNWKHVIPAIRSVRNTTGAKKTSFLICFDADLKQNQAVAKNAKDLALFLMKEFADSNVYFADWDIADGKGIDDVVNAGNTKKLRRYPAEKYLQNPFFNKKAGE